MPAADALIFDFDGVIVESEHIKTRAFAQLYHEHGPDAVAYATTHHQANGGISRRKKIRHYHAHLLGITLDGEALEDLCRRFSALVEDEVVACDWVPGARAVLAEQASRRPLFVVSGTPHDELVRIIERRGLTGVFSEVYGSPPDKATTIRAILARRGFAPHRVLFIGDAAADWRAARETGLRFIGVVADGRASPFPPGTPAIRDLTQFVL